MFCCKYMYMYITHVYVSPPCHDKPQVGPSSQCKD